MKEAEYFNDNLQTFTTLNHLFTVFQKLSYPIKMCYVPFIQNNLFKEDHFESLIDHYRGILIVGTYQHSMIYYCVDI